MADMHDCGVYTFKMWAYNGRDRWLGEFNPDMSAEEANRIEEGGGKIDQNGKLVSRLTQSGQDAFTRGWKRAQEEYKKGLWNIDDVKREYCQNA